MIISNKHGILQVAEQLKTQDLRTSGKIRKISKPHRIITQRPASPPIRKPPRYKQQTTEKQKLEFSCTALFHMKTRVFSYILPTTVAIPPLRIPCSCSCQGQRTTTPRNTTQRILMPCIQKVCRNYVTKTPSPLQHFVAPHHENNDASFDMIMTIMTALLKVINDALWCLHLIVKQFSS